MLDNDQIIVLILLAITGIYMWFSSRLDKTEVEAFRRGYERGVADGRAIRANSK